MIGRLIAMSCIAVLMFGCNSNESSVGSYSEPKGWSGALNEATVKSNKGDCEGACAIMDEVIKNNPDFVPAYRARSVFKCQKGDCADALADVNFAIEREPNNSTLRYKRILLNAKMKNAAGVDEDVKFIESHDNKNFLGYYKMGEAMTILTDAKSPEAIKFFDESIARDPTVGAYNLRGLNKYNLGDYKSAEADFTASLKLKLLPNTYKMRAHTREALGDKEGALSDFEKAEKIKTLISNTK